MRRLTDDAADADRGDLDRVEGVGDIELLQLARAPAGDVEDLVIDAQLDIRHQGWHGLERLEGRRQLILVRGFGRNGDDLGDVPAVRRSVRARLAVPEEDR